MIRAGLMIALLASAFAAPVTAKPRGKAVLPPATNDTRIVRPAATVPETPIQPVQPVKGPEGCPTPAGGEAAADWRPPPIPPKEARGGAPAVVPQGGKAASDWRPPPIPPHDPNQPACPQQSDSADWRPPPIPPKR